MDLAKYDNNLSDVTDYLSELGIDDRYLSKDINLYRYYVPYVDFVILIYRFEKIERFNLYNHNLFTCLDFNNIRTRFCSVDLSDEEYRGFIRNIKDSFNIINIIDLESNNMLKTMLTLKDLDNYLKENLPSYKRDNIINGLLED